MSESATENTLPPRHWSEWKTVAGVPIEDATEEGRRAFWGLKEGEEFDDTPVSTGKPNHSAESYY